MRYLFADCEFDTQLAVLRRGPHVVNLRPKVAQVLRYLLEQRAQVVTKHALLEAVWPDQYISDATLTDIIRVIRRAVGDTAHQSQIIQTRHGHGYRFVAEVSLLPRCLPDTPEPPAPASGPASTDPPIPETMALTGGEHKVVTVLCVGLGQSTVLLAQQGLDALHTLMRTRYALLTHAVQQYAGMMLPLVGAQALAVFGVPMTHEDHAPRAGLAALAVREHLETHRQACDVACQAALTLRIGLHTGQVAVVLTDPASIPAPMVVGEAVLLAIALQEHAEPGTILCSEATARLLQEVADVVAAPSRLPLPTQPEPVQAYTLLAPRPLPGPPYTTRPRSPFVGRTQELATLQALLAQVHEGQGHVVGLVGEPGIGKSRLLYEFRHSQQHKPLTYIAAQCLSYGTTTPYGPVRQLLRQLCALTETDAPETVAHKVSQSLDAAQMASDRWAPLLLHLLGQASRTHPMATLSPQEHRERTFAAMVQFCVQRSQHGPLVLEMENLHWMDATSEAWLAALVEHVAQRPILIVGTYRPGYRPPWLGASYVTQLALARLAPRESLQVLRSIPQGEQLAEPLTRELLRKAEGNPFFIEELTQAVVAGGLDHLLEIPQTIQSVLASRIDRLAPAEKRLLQVAAVIGKDVDLPLLEDMAALPMEGLREGLQRLQTAEFLYETRLLPIPAYTFKHVLTQEVAYQSLLLSTRQPYHQQIAELLRERFPEKTRMHPELLAHHYTEAGLLEQALPYWQRAGEEAVARSANVEAISHFTKGLEVLQRLPVTMERHRHELRLQLALSTPLFIRRQIPAIVYLSHRVLALSQEVGDSVQYFSGLMELWRSFFNMGQLQAAWEIGQQCLTLAQGAQDATLLLEAHMMLGSTCLPLGELLTARAHFQHSERLYVTQPASARIVRRIVDDGVVCLCREAWTLWLLGYADQALAASNQALTLARTTAHAFSLAFALLHAGIIHKCRREIGVALEYVEAMITLARQHEFVYYVSGGLCLQSLFLAAQGASVDFARLLEVVSAWTEDGPMYGRTALYLTLAEVYYTDGQIDTGLRVLHEARSMIETMAERFYEAEVYRLRGLCLLHPAALDMQQAEDCLQRACAIAARQHAKIWELRSTMSLSRLWHQQGNALAARQRLEQIYGWFTEGFETSDLREARELLDVLP